MKLHVGILSPFYQNYNYGGKLQAYAMVQVFQKLGCEAQQIQYCQHRKNSQGGFAKKLGKVCSHADYRAAAAQKLLKKLLIQEQGQLAARKAAFARFDCCIPHTEAVYSDRDIAQAADFFEVFVCGSDQVWNPALFKRAYFLDFVPEEKYKFSYAASIVNTLSVEWQHYFQRQLAGFNDISVREEGSRILLTKLLGRQVTLAGDPTLLLKQEDWIAAAAEVSIDTPYLFCYFLGYSAKMRKNAEQFAGKHCLTIVTLPHLLGISGRCYLCDVGFGDKRLYDVSPAQFITLIKNADYILTDSFHATVLSLIFEKQFITFPRTNLKEMDSRVTGLLDLFGLEKQMCREGESIEKIFKALDTPIPYQRSDQKLGQIRNNSWAYLTRNLQMAEDHLKL